MYTLIHNTYTQPVRRIIQGSFQPLYSCSVLSISHQAHKMSCNPTTSLTPHWIPLVRHSTGAYLVCFKWFLQLLLVC